MVQPISIETRELVRIEFDKRFLTGDNYEIVSGIVAAQRINAMSGKSISKSSVKNIYNEFSLQYYQAYQILQQRVSF
jgi:hypothetical protein